LKILYLVKNDVDIDDKLKNYSKITAIVNSMSYTREILKKKNNKIIIYRKDKGRDGSDKKTRKKT
jgi:hypothetical protein